MTYGQKLKDPRWQRVRLEILSRDGWKCQHCACEDQSLQVHHLLYQRGKEPWEYDSDNLTTLCENCHASVTATVNRVRKLMEWEVTASILGETAELLDAGYFVEVSEAIIEIKKSKGFV